MTRIILSLCVFLAASCAQTPANSAAQDSEVLMAKANVIIRLLEAADFKSLSSQIHEDSGLSFSPYSRDLSELFVIRFSKDAISKFGTDSKMFLWGYYDGTGYPIELTPMEYYKAFVYDISYIEKAESIFVGNEELQSNHRFKAVYRAYPDSNLIHYHYEGSANAGYKDFKDLIFVFSKIDGDWYLVGLTHGESTV